MSQIGSNDLFSFLTDWHEEFMSNKMHYQPTKIRLLLKSYFRMSCNWKSVTAFWCSFRDVKFMISWNFYKLYPVIEPFESYLIIFYRCAIWSRCTEHFFISFICFIHSRFSFCLVPLRRRMFGYKKPSKYLLTTII